MILLNELTLLALQTLCLVVLPEQTGLPTFNDFMSWLTLLALQTLRLLELLEQTGLLTFSGLTSSLTLLVKMGLTCTLTSFTLIAGLHWCKCDSLISDKICWQTLYNGGKWCSFNENELQFLSRDTSRDFIFTIVTIWIPFTSVRWKTYPFSVCAPKSKHRFYLCHF